MLGGATRVVAVLLAAVCALAAPAAGADGTPRHVAAADSLESEVLLEINAFRARNGLRPLRLSAPLSAAADAHSRAMVANGFFAHSSADGTAFWKRVRRWYGSRGYGYWSVGENLLWASPGVDARRALGMWLASPPHRQNLLTARWREIGLSAVRASSAPGTFGRREVTVITTDFGVRR